jgi:hypothetical protein
MLAEQKELYNYTKDHFENDLKLIWPTCCSPIIAIRQVVKKAIEKYIIDYCDKDTNPLEIFSENDFQEVSNKIYNELMEG